MREKKLKNFTTCLHCYTAGCTVTPSSSIQCHMWALWKGDFTFYQMIILQFPTMEGVAFESNRIVMGISAKNIDRYVSIFLDIESNDTKTKISRK